MNTDDSRWRAVLDRDRAADGRFWYAVRTTGVFCRPSCASRSPRRDNVAFYDSPVDAVRAGFRPCRRCRPTEEDPRDRHTRSIVAACRTLEGDEAVTTTALARAADLGPNQFLRRFKQHTGVSPQAYRRRARAERAKAELATAGSVTEAAIGSGYAPSTFYAQVGPELGMAPSEARTGADRQVWYTVRGCTLGRILVGWTERGVCEVGFGDTDQGLVDDLARRLPRARLAESVVPEWVDAVVDRVDLGRVRDVPLDIQGTAFQERVWAELRRIPPGETRSYAEVAAAIGSPGSARAVARACATNPVAVLVPCHRVVRSDGERSGYRWGPERKRQLLDREGR